MKAAWGCACRASYAALQWNWMRTYECTLSFASPSCTSHPLLTLKAAAIYAAASSPAGGQPGSKRAALLLACAYAMPPSLPVGIAQFEDARR